MSSPKLRYNSYLQFGKPEDTQLYREYSKNQTHGILSILLLTVIKIDVGFRVNYPHAIHLNYWFVISGFFYIMAMTFLFIYVQGVIGEHFNIKIFEIKRASKLIQNFLDELPSIIMLIFTICWIALSIARVLRGKCPSNVSNFNGDTFSNCNTLAQSNSPPIDSIMLSYVVSGYMQIVFKSVRKYFLCIVWLL
jgi:hypothetical protein